MRRTCRGALILILAVGGLTACGDSTTPTADPVPDPNTSPSPGSVAECVAGTWRSTAVRTAAGGDVASARVDGGSGITVRIADNGGVSLDFAGMQPATFSAQVAGVDVRGSFRYAGNASGQITTQAGGITPGGASPDEESPGEESPGGQEPAASGTWEPIGDIDWSRTRVTVDLTEPVEARPADDVEIGDFVANAQTGDAVDIDPFFDRGTYECTDDQLVITPDEEGDLTWTLEAS
jgi:hypothetical protein